MTLCIGVLDDDRGILYTLEAMGRSQGWTMCVTGDPEGALRWVAEGAVDLMLVDYHMPQMSGPEFLRRARRVSKRVVLLGLTVEERMEIAQEMLEAGADDFVTKPVKLADFAARIHLHASLARMKEAALSATPKHIHHDTLERVLAALRSFRARDHRPTSQEVAAETGLSYPTVRRYLEYLSGQEQVEQAVAYQDGRPGRPLYTYRLRDET